MKIWRPNSANTIRQKQINIITSNSSRKARSSAFTIVLRPEIYHKIEIHMSQRMTNPTKWPVCPAKTQISSMIRVLTVRLMKVWVLSNPKSAQIDLFFIGILWPVKIISPILSRVNPKVRQKKGDPREKPPEPASRTQLVLHVTRARFESTAVRWRAIYSTKEIGSLVL